MNYHFYKITNVNKRIDKIKKMNSHGEFVSIKTFEQPVTKDKLPKIYIVKSNDAIIYIGIASQGIRKRLNYGFQAKGKGGYYGYKWKHINDFDLIIWCFPEKKDLKDIEGIEAELVYLIRHKTGSWPKYQSEIHFHQATEQSKVIAAKIYQEIKA